ncbi:glycosyltransferase family 4 protein [Maritalea myrionectae]|uniref:glycosyltransferase family 4 protein n=1 Tax=Maritalea myrionectae TaxID=454601 RepID=UPI0004124473|nr:glycosyltransferase family 1 protein [Maritalea myrionectae]
MTRLLIVTDAWHPQVNGVVRCLDKVGQELRAIGYQVDYLTPERFWTMPLPTYPEIRLSLAWLGEIGHIIEQYDPDHIHIATEGPLGLMARYICTAQHWAFTTSYHTRFPEYVAARIPVPCEWSYAYLRWFHEAATHTLAPTRSVVEDLKDKDFQHVVEWTRGVDSTRFAPGEKTLFQDLPGPHLLCVGRVSVEKNVEAFLRLNVPGTKIVVGDGPQRAELESNYPDAVFVGRKQGEELTAHYQSADVFVFPSKTDTFGNVMLEAMACGVPVAAYPVMGPIDVLTDPRAGVMDDDLAVATEKALKLKRADARSFALNYSWAACAVLFRQYLVPVASGRERAA